MRKSPNSRFGLFKIFFLACSPLLQSAFLHWGVVSELTAAQGPILVREKEDEAIGPIGGSTSRKPWERVCRARRDPTRKSNAHLHGRQPGTDGRVRGGDTGPLTEPHLSLDALELPGGTASLGQLGQGHYYTWEPVRHHPTLCRAPAFCF